MVGMILGFIESRWKPFAVVFSFFLVGLIDTMAVRTHLAGNLSRRSLFIVALVNAFTLVYLWRLGARTSFYIQPRSRAVVFAVGAFLVGMIVALTQRL